MEGTLNGGGRGNFASANAFRKRQRRLEDVRRRPRARGCIVDLYTRDIVGLVGDNGAGKSTLIKILSGALAATYGEIEVEGRPVTLAPPAEAQRLGVETVYQDLSLISGFTAAENVFLGRELSSGRGPSMFRLMRRKAMANATVKGLKTCTLRSLACGRDRSNECPAVNDNWWPLHAQLSGAANFCSSTSQPPRSACANHVKCLS